MCVCVCVFVNACMHACTCIHTITHLWVFFVFLRYILVKRCKSRLRPRNMCARTHDAKELCNQQLRSIVRGGKCMHFPQNYLHKRNFLTLTDRQGKKKERGCTRERNRDRLAERKGGGPFFSQGSNRRYPLSFSFAQNGREFHEASQRCGYKHLRCGLCLEAFSTHPNINQADE